MVRQPKGITCRSQSRNFCFPQQFSKSRTLSWTLRTTTQNSILVTLPLLVSINKRLGFSLLGAISLSPEPWVTMLLAMSPKSVPDRVPLVMAFHRLSFTCANFMKFVVLMWRADYNAQFSFFPKSATGPRDPADLDQTLIKLHDRGLTSRDLG